MRYTLKTVCVDTTNRDIRQYFYIDFLTWLNTCLCEHVISVNAFMNAHHLLKKAHIMAPLTNNPENTEGLSMTYSL